jgi:hypothetical protein
MHKKGQATMETIFIYGLVAIVVVGGIGALLYFDVLNLGNYLPDRCTISNKDISCEEWAVSGTAGIELGLKNLNQRNMTVKSVTYTHSDGIPVFSAGPSSNCTVAVTVDSGHGNPGDIIGTGSNCPFVNTYIGQKHKFDVAVTYVTGTIDQIATGTLIAKVS